MTHPDILEEGRPYGFSPSELTAALRRVTGKPDLTLVDLQPTPIPQQRPSLGRVRGLRLTTESQGEQEEVLVVVKQPFAASRMGAGNAGFREASFYLNFADQLPIQIPDLIAASPRGDWLVLNLLPEATPVAAWSADDYRAAVNNLARLHDRFWNLGQDLVTYPWLARPLKADLDVYLQASRKGLNNLQQISFEHPLNQDPTLAPMLEKLTAELPVIAARLEKLPTTLLHGDYWPGNLFLYPDGKLITLDWQRAGIGPGILDLANFVQSSLWWMEKLPLPTEELVQTYRAALASMTGYQEADSEWGKQWEDALLWIFASNWLDLLANIPPAILETRRELLYRVWLEPVRQAAARRIPDLGLPDLGLPGLAKQTGVEKEAIAIQKVAVFGSSWPKEGDPEYQEAYLLGRLLAETGYTVLNGGYIGSMEAVSRGANEAGGKVVGVTCDEIEAWRPVKPNPYLTEEIRLPTLRERLGALMDHCDAAIALPGGVGTLTEISILWNHLLTKAVPPRPLILIGAGWKKVVETFFEEMGVFLPEQQRRWVTFAETPADAVKRLRND